MARILSLVVAVLVSLVGAAFGQTEAQQAVKDNIDFAAGECSLAEDMSDQEKAAALFDRNGIHNSTTNWWGAVDFVGPLVGLGATAWEMQFGLDKITSGDAHFDVGELDEADAEALVHDATLETAPGALAWYFDADYATAVTHFNTAIPIIESARQSFLWAYCAGFSPAHLDYEEAYMDFDLLYQGFFLP